MRCPAIGINILKSLASASHCTRLDVLRVSDRRAVFDADINDSSRKRLAGVEGVMSIVRVRKAKGRGKAIVWKGRGLVK